MAKVLREIDDNPVQYRSFARDALIKTYESNAIDIAHDNHTALISHIKHYIRHLPDEIEDNNDTYILSSLSDHFTKSIEYERALEISELIYNARITLMGEFHKDTLGAANDLILINRHFGNYEEILRLQNDNYVRALKAGVDIHNLLIQKTNISQTYRMMGRLEEALTAQIEVLEEMKKPSHFTMAHKAAAVGNYIQILLSMERIDEAIERLRAHIEYFKNHVENSSKEVASMLMTLSRALQSKGDIGGAIDACFKSIELREKCLGPTNVITLLSINGLACLYTSNHQYDKAIGIFKLNLENSKEYHGPSHRCTLKIMNDLASCLSKSGRFHDAIDVYNDIIKKTKESLGDEHDIVQHAMQQIDVLGREL